MFLSVTCSKHDGGRMIEVNTPRPVAKATLRLADVRVLDLREPYHPKEFGHFIPPITAATDKRCVEVDGQERCKTAIQSNNVETDELLLLRTQLVERRESRLDVLTVRRIGVYVLKRLHQCLIFGTQLLAHFI
jgi:hypothetical protein